MRSRFGEIGRSIMAASARGNRVIPDVRFLHQLAGRDESPFFDREHLEIHEAECACFAAENAREVP
ncbi:MAG: hypothetical protein L0Z07_07300 [Planctomycetes bacterium]|nr:hypothetical protein [Planctomycetota bacterium]